MALANWTPQRLWELEEALALETIDDVSITDAKCYEVTNGTILTGTVQANAGDIVLATISHRSVFTTPPGWTQLYESTASLGSNQKMVFAIKRIEEDGEVSFTAIQSSSGRIYLNLIAFGGLANIKNADRYEASSSSAVTAITVPDKQTTGEKLVWGVSANLWLSDGQWTCTPNDLQLLQLPSSTQARQLNAIDLGAGAVANRKFIPNAGSGTTLVVSAVELMPPRVELTTYTAQAILASDRYRLKWVEDKPEGTDVLVEYTLDESQEEWQPAVNGRGIDIDESIWIRVTLSTEDPEVTPTITDMWLEEASVTSPIKPVTVRAGEEVGLISMAVQTVDGHPYKLWSLYDHAGEIHLATCEDVDVLPTNWKVVEILDIDAREVAIVFDGDWEWHDELRAWRIHTEETPWVFWVNSYGVLKAQKYGEETVTDLAYNVSGLSALRGWKNPTFKDQDQGIIVSYLRNGGLFYRNYAIQTTSETVWEPEKEIYYPDNTLVESAQLFLLNDYRTGIAIEDAEGLVHWAITPRNWAGMGVAPEYLDASPVTAMVILGAPTINAFLEVYNQPVVIEGDEVWSREIVFEVRHKLYEFNVLDFELVGIGGPYYPETVEHLGGNTYKLVFNEANDFNNIRPGNSATLHAKGLYALNEDGVLYDPFQMTFTPDGLVIPGPIDVPIAELLEASPVTASVNFADLEYLDAFYVEQEKLTASPVTASVVFADVGIINP